ncbi:MAG: methyl-accepting chemotaxis protein [Treponema sp.]|nr:methyl-accepting chemotaxis protein [Treponema sp.]
MKELAMSNNNKKGKNGKIVITFIAIMTIIVTIINVTQFVVVSGFIKKRLLDENIDRYTELSLNYSRIIEQTIDEYLAKLDYYLQQDVVLTEDSDEISEWLTEHEKNRPSEFSYVGWVDLSGQIYTDIGNNADVSDRGYYKAIVKEGKTVSISNPEISKTTNARVVHMAKAVRRNGKLLGAFVGVINIDIPGIFLGKIDNSTNVLTTLFSGDGQFMGMTGDTSLNGLDKADAASIEKVNIEINTNIRQGKNGYLWVVVPGAPTTGMFYSPIKYTDWSVSLTLDQRTILHLSKIVSNLLTIFSIVMTLGVIGSVWIVLYISLRPLKKLEDAITDISSGHADLTKRIDIQVNNEIGRVVDRFNHFCNKLQRIMSSMKQSKEDLVKTGAVLNSNTENTASSIIEILSNIESMGNNIEVQSDIVTETASAVNEIASNIESLNNMIDTQATAVTQASAAVEEMIGNITSVSNSVRKMNNEFDDLQVRIGNGIDLQQAVNEKIHEIEIESKALQDANTVIADIASQTNLLAMNAAIEAAHAGDAGKGFSVVADEIRKLSENSTAQSNSIGKQLSTIQNSIEQIVVVSQQAKDAFSLVSNGISGTSDLVKEISYSMDEQAEGSKQISIALSNMNNTSSEVQNSSQEMSAGNKVILDEIKRLQDSTFSMKTGMEEMSTGAALVNKTGNELSEISRLMDESITQIGSQVDQFTV